MRLRLQFYLEYVNTSGIHRHSSAGGAVEQGGLTAWTIPGGVASGYEISRARTLAGDTLTCRIPAESIVAYGSFYYKTAMRERYSYDPSNKPGD